MIAPAARRARALLAGLAALIAGCAAGPVAWTPAAAPAALDDARAAYTRKAEVYEELQGRLFVRATLHAPPFAAALADWKAERFGLDPAARAAAVAAAVAQARDETRFFLALATRHHEWNDLGHRDGTMRVRMQVGDEWVEPVSIHQLDLNEMVDRRVIFPYAGDLTIGYDIVFPKVTDPKRIRLQLVGIPARGDLVWTIE